MVDLLPVATSNPLWASVSGMASLVDLTELIAYPKPAEQGADGDAEEAV
jgi:hypothetical protein